LGLLGQRWRWQRLNHGYIDSPLPKKWFRFPKTADKPPFQTIAEIERKIARGQEQAELWDAAFLTLPEIDELLSVVKHRALYAFLYQLAHTKLIPTAPRGSMPPANHLDSQAASLFAEQMWHDMAATDREALVERIVQKLRKECATIAS
jgi:hypothetical protein